jgi:hypothetical protein
MKKIITLVVALALAVSMLGLLSACGRGAGDIESITVSENKANGVDIKVYQVSLKDTIVWADLSDGDRERIAVAAFNEAQKKIAENNIFNYSIIGRSADQPVAFMYDAENRNMVIFIANQPVSEVGVEVPER